MEKGIKIAILNKSDSTGGAAVVSHRLMEALRREGADARMIVCEKFSDSPYVSLAASRVAIKRQFILERLKIFISNGFNRTTLFKIDTGETGLPLWRNPIVKEADAIMINWVNQGMLSLSGLKKILKLNKPVIFTLHDMWWATGICHHAATCRQFEEECGLCPLLNKKASPDDLSRKIWKRKNRIFSDKSLMRKTAFVSVSNWLNRKCLESSLLSGQNLEVIPNTFDIQPVSPQKSRRDKIRLLFGAARIDDPIKGLDTLKITSEIINNENPGLASKMEIAMFGNVKNPESLEGFRLPVILLGTLRGEKALAEAYTQADILVSASSYETFAATLVEAQAYGCIPVSFSQGGQTDIITDGHTGFLAEYDPDITVRARNLADKILHAASITLKSDRLDEMRPEEMRLKEMRKEMTANVKNKFSYHEVARKYLALIEKLRVNL